MKPALPDERPRLPRDVFRDLKASAREELLDDVCAAYAMAGQAMDDGKPHEALPALEWAKSVAARSAVVREALGVVQYMKGDFEAARSELQTYRRISGKHDQNHLLADCARAQGRSEKVEEYVEEMLRADVPAERVAEGVIVLAADRADRGDLEGALAALERIKSDTVPEGEPRVRWWYMAADLHNRLGNQDAERDYLERITEVDADYLDVMQRWERGGT